MPPHTPPVAILIQHGSYTIVVISAPDSDAEPDHPIDRDLIETYLDEMCSRPAPSERPALRVV